MTDYTVLTQLGTAITAPISPDAAVLERARVLTGEGPQDEWIVESKSLKLFLASFRNHGAFHEACTMNVARRVVEVVAPRWLRIGAYWYPRGGIPIDVFWQTGAPPEGVWLPDQGVAPYRGRG